MAAISVFDVTVGESDAFAVFEVRLDAPSINAVTVNYYTRNGIADYWNDADYVRINSSILTFAPGETVKTVQVAITNNAVAEATENFVLVLADPSAGNYLAKAWASATIIDNDGPTGTPVVSVGDLVVDEQGREATFVITLDRPSTGTVSFNYATQNGTATAGSDYVATSGSLSFAPGEMVKTVKVTLVNDSAAELSESFKLVLSNVSGATSRTPEATAVIYENDAPQVAQPTISVVGTSTVGEGDTYAEFIVTLSSPSINTVSVRYETRDGTAGYWNFADYQSQDGVLTFAPGETVKTVRVLLADDIVAERTENFFIFLSDAVNSSIANPRAMATIVDNDAPAGTPVVSVGNLVVDEQSREASFVITLDRPSTGVVSFNYATQNGTAVAGADYVATSGSLSFGPGEVTKTVKVTLIDDTTAELSESFKLVLSNLSGATSLTPEATAVIHENDATPVSQPAISVGDITVGEDATYAEFVVSLSGPSSNTVSVLYETRDGTAENWNLADYQQQNSRVTFAPGETVKTVRVLLNNDTVAESTERFVLSLYDPFNASISKATGTATIIDNDATVGTPRVSVGDLIVDEQSREASFVITLDRPSTSIVSFNYATQDGTAQAGTDYIATSGSLTFGPGEVTKTVKVTLNNDTAAELSESFALVLSNFSGATSLVPTGTATIYANDGATTTQPFISVDNTTVDESQTFAEFVVRLSGPSTNTTSVNFATFNGSASSSTDFHGTSGYLTFAPGETVKTVRVQLQNDTTSERTEEFGLRLTQPTNGTIVKAIGTATIVDNDTPVGTPIASVGHLIVDEGDREAYFIVTLDRVSTGVVSFDYATQNGSAMAGADYTAATGRLFFLPGEMVKTVKVTLNNDTVLESNESFHLTLSNFSGASALDAIGTAIIHDNDAAAAAQPVVRVNDLVVGEGQAAEWLVELSAPSTQIVTVNYGISAFAGSGSGGSIVFLPGETAKTVRLLLDEDTVANATQNIFFNLTSATNAVVGQTTSLTTIVDNDASIGTPGISVNDVFVDEEHGFARFSVVLDRPSQSYVTVSYATQNETATAGADFLAVSGTLVFQPGQVVQEVVVALVNDTTAEDLESFRLVLANAVNATLTDAVGHAAIMPSDLPVVASPLISVSSTNGGVVAEGGQFAEFVVWLSAPSAGSVTVSYSTQNSTATSSNDYVATSGVLRFAPGEMSKVIQVPIRKDLAAEETEAFSLRLSNAVGATLNGEANVAAVAIIDDDSGFVVIGKGRSDDTYDLTSPDIVIVDTGGIDTIRIAESYTLTGNFENLTLTGTAAINGTGNELDNVLVGNSANNVLEGLAGNDVLDGGAGNDTMTGGAGNDTYYVDAVGDVVIETGTSTTEIDTVISSISYTLGNNVENLTLTGTAAINGTGNALDNVIIGNAGANQLSGGAGNDTLNGGAGNDTMNGGAGNDTYYVDAVGDVVVETGTSATEIDTVVSSISYALGANVERLTLSGAAHLNGTGNALNNVIIGNAGNNVLNGGAGNDTMTGGAGNDTYYVDAVGDVVVETGTSATEIDTVISSINYTLGNNVENLTLVGTANRQGIGNELNNTLTGNAGNNFLGGGGGHDKLFGGAGVDTLSGGSGNDVLDGGSGADAMTGGSGNDTYYVDDAGDTVVETGTALTEIDTVVSSISYTLGNNLENLTLTGTADLQGIGNALNNVLIGNGGNNFLGGGAGNDTLNGGAGADTLIGGSGADVLNGGSGSDILDGGSGADTMTGGSGNDTYYVDVAGDVVIETGTALTEIDTVISSINYTLGDNVENLTLSGAAHLQGIGNALNNTLTGNAGNNLLGGGAGNDTLFGGAGVDTLSGGSGSDVLDGGSGADAMTGGSGNDTYYVDDAGDTVIETGTALNEIDTVISSINYTLGSNVENLTLAGTANLQGIGNALNNVIIGNAGDNFLGGGAGNDIINGGAGADTLVGGAGNDRMTGGSGNDTYYVDSTGDVIIETGTSVTEIDTVISSINYTLGNNVENLTLAGTANFQGIGNALNNTITGNAGNNFLGGGAGNDTLVGGNGNDSLVGGSGNDTLVGGNGADTLNGGSGKDAFVFNTALGVSNIDTIADFAPSVDAIHLDDAIFSALAANANGTLSAAQFHIGAAATNANQKILYDTNTGSLSYDADGSGAGAAQQFATLQTGLNALAATDFFVV